MELLVFICLATVAFYGLFLWLLVSLLWRGEAGPRTRSFVANGLFLLAAFATLGAVVETVSGFRWGRSLGELAVYAALLPSFAVNALRLALEFGLWPGLVTGAACWFLSRHLYGRLGPRAALLAAAMAGAIAMLAAIAAAIAAQSVVTRARIERAASVIGAELALHYGFQSHLSAASPRGRPHAIACIDGKALLWSYWQGAFVQPEPTKAQGQRADDFDSYCRR
ncbi:hypothetical protein [Seohaeicola zhoushanensis]|nr:hypothetical protein [Seohaeicola zhoushanensis]